MLAWVAHGLSFHRHKSLLSYLLLHLWIGWTGDVLHVGALGDTSGAHLGVV